MSDLGETKLREYLAHPAVSEAVKAGLTRALELGQRKADAEKTFADLKRQLKAVSVDQARLRENLHVIPQTSEPYKDFLKKFVTQEAEIDALQQRIRQAEVTRTTVQREYQVFVTTWNAE